MSPIERKQTFHKAIGTFLFCAGIIYTSALTYSIVTGATFAATLLACAMAGIGVLSAWMIKTSRF
jgi:hypothetical protein